MWEVTSIDRASQLLGPYYMATLGRHFRIWGKRGGKRCFIRKNLSFGHKVSPKEKEMTGRLRLLLASLTYDLLNDSIQRGGLQVLSPPPLHHLPCFKNKVRPMHQN